MVLTVAGCSIEELKQTKSNLDSVDSVMSTDILKGQVLGKSKEDILNVYSNLEYTVYHEENINPNSIKFVINNIILVINFDEIDKTANSVSISSLGEYSKALEIYVQLNKNKLVKNFSGDVISESVSNHDLLKDSKDSVILYIFKK